MFKKKSASTATAKTLLVFQKKDLPQVIRQFSDIRPQEFNGKFYAVVGATKGSINWPDVAAGIDAIGA